MGERGSAGARVASLLPAATEIVCALGAGARLVARSHECDHPPEVARIPSVTSSRLGPPGRDGASGAIDRDVRALATDALGLYRVDADALRAAAPDVIVTQDLCDVCAVSFKDVERAVREVLGGGAEVVSLKPLRLGDVWDDVRRVASALGRTGAGAALVASLEERVAAVAERAREAERRPSVLTIEWLDPVMVGGTWMPELVELAGGTALVTRPGEHAPTLDADALAELRPEVVLVKPCGYGLERSRVELGTVRVLVDKLAPERAYVADGNAFFNRPGPRLVESLEILAACVHPSRFADLASKHARSVLAL